jgi:hypothetical protein
MSAPHATDALPADRIRAIDARIRTRHAELGLSDVDKPEYGLAPLPPSEPYAGADMRALIEHLAAAYRSFRTPPIELELAPSPATRLPVLGPIWARIRASAHKLPLFYAHRAALRQMAVQRALLSALNLLTVRVQRQRRELAELHATRDGGAPR